MKFYYPKNGKGDAIAFKTSESQVYDKTGKPLTDKLTDLYNKINEAKLNFQVGVEGIYNAIVAQGTTPASKSQSDIETSIGTLATDKYDEGIEVGQSTSKSEYEPKSVEVTNGGSITVKNVSGKTVLTSTTDRSYDAGNTAGQAAGKANYEPTSASVTQAGAITVTNKAGSTVLSTTTSNSYDAGNTAGQETGKYNYEPTSASITDAGVITAKNKAGVTVYTSSAMSNSYDTGVTDGKNSMSLHSLFIYGGIVDPTIGGSQLFYSNDNTTLIEMSIPTTNKINCITYGNGRFVCVSYGESYYSTDGKTWNAMSGLDVNTDYNGVTYGNGRFVCVGNRGKSYYSTDGTTWNPGSTSLWDADNLFCVTYGNDKFFTIATALSGSRSAIFCSKDCLNWDLVGVPWAYYLKIGSITYGNGRFVCVGNSGKSYYSQYNENNFHEMTGLNLNTDYNGVTYGNGRFVCVGKLGLSHYSTDGTTWVAMSGLDTSFNYKAVAYGNGRFVCVGNNTSGSLSCKFYYSTDGTTWNPIEKISTSTLGLNIYSIASNTREC